MTTATTPLLEGRNLRKTYRLSRRNQVQALRGVDLDIARGEMVAIMGPSGSGKSTLMHILGLLHSADRDGGPAPELRIEGQEVGGLSDRERTRMRADAMGFVFQAYNLIPTLTALEARSAAMEALSWVGLAERHGHRPMELSGGEQQRVAIARSLVNEPMLLLADEPTGNLDSAMSGDVLALLRRFNRDRGQTLVLVTHDPDVGGVCDRIIHMRDGLCERSESLIGAASTDGAAVEAAS